LGLQAFLFVFSGAVNKKNFVFKKLMKQMLSYEFVLKKDNLNFLNVLKDICIKQEFNFISE
jgi:hypothetical protein